MKVSFESKNLLRNESFFDISSIFYFSQKCFFPVLISQKKTGICEQKPNIQDGHKKEAGNDRQNVRNACELIEKIK